MNAIGSWFGELAARFHEASSERREEASHSPLGAADSTIFESTGLLPLAVLTQTADASQTLRQVAERVESIPELRVQSNVAASAGILAGLLLKRDFINQVLRRDIMQQSVIYQDILQEGSQAGETKLVLRLLSRRIGEVSPEMRSQIQALPLDQLESLGEALLDFTKPSDLDDWMRSR